MAKNQSILDSLIDWLNKQDGGEGLSSSTLGSNVYTDTFGGAGQIQRRRKKNPRAEDFLKASEETNPIWEDRVDYDDPNWIKYIREHIDLDHGGIVKSSPTMQIGFQTYALEVAQDKALGLSGRKSLGKNCAMMFAFQDNSPHVFHMNGMQFPIDMICIGEDKCVLQVERNVQPDEGIRIWFPPCLCVLEVNAGEAEDIAVGDVVSVGVGNLQKQLSPSEAKNRGLVPQSGDWNKPYRWIKSEETPAKPDTKNNFEKDVQNFLDFPLEDKQWTLGNFRNPEDIEFLGIISKIQKQVKDNLRESLSPKEISWATTFINKYSSEEIDYDEFERETLKNPAQRKIINALKKESQKVFGDKPRRLYRGVRQISKRKGVEEGISLKVRATPLSSWTTDVLVAREFGPYILAMDASPEDIMLAPVIGPGTYAREYAWQKEFVIHKKDARNNFFNATLEEIGEPLSFRKEENNNDSAFDADVEGPMRRFDEIQKQWASAGGGGFGGPGLPNIYSMPRKTGFIGPSDIIRKLAERQELNTWIQEGQSEEEKRRKKQEKTEALYEYVQKQLSPAEARSHGWVPESGDWSKPYRWVNAPDNKDAPDNSPISEVMNSDVFKAAETLWNKLKFVDDLEEPASFYSLNDEDEVEKNFILEQFHGLKRALQIQIGQAPGQKGLKNLENFLLDYEFVDDANGDIAGFSKVFVSLTDNEFHIADVVVSPMHHRQKSDKHYGTRLMMSTMKRFIENDDVDFASTMPLTDHVAKYYRQFGFKYNGDLAIDKETAKKSYNRLARFFGMDIVKSMDDPWIRELLALEQEHGVLAHSKQKQKASPERISKSSDSQFGCPECEQDCNCTNGMMGCDCDGHDCMCPNMMLIIDCMDDDCDLIIDSTKLMG